MIDKGELDIEEIVDLAMQDTVPFAAISDQFGLTADDVVAIMRKHLSYNSYKRWKERRGLPAFRKQSSMKAQKHRIRST